MNAISPFFIQRGMTKEQSETDRQPNGCFWKINTPHGTHYLLGTLEESNEYLNRMNSVVIKALETSEDLVVLTDFSTLTSNPSFLKDFQETIVNLSEKSLKQADEYSPEEREKMNREIFTTLKNKTITVGGFSQGMSSVAVDVNDEEEFADFSPKSLLGNIDLLVLSVFEEAHVSQRQSMDLLMTNTAIHLKKKIIPLNTPAESQKKLLENLKTTPVVHNILTHAKQANLKTYYQEKVKASQKVVRAWEQGNPDAAMEGLIHSYADRVELSLDQQQVTKVSELLKDTASHFIALPLQSIMGKNGLIQQLSSEEISFELVAPNEGHHGPRGLFFEIQDDQGRTRGHLLGTLHLDIPLNDDIQKAYESSNELIIEHDVETERVLNAVKAVKVNLYRADIEKLDSSELAPAKKELEDFFKGIQLDPSQLEEIVQNSQDDKEIILKYLFLKDSLEGKRSEIKAMDLTLSRKAKEDGKPIRELDSDQAIEEAVQGLVEKDTSAEEHRKTEFAKAIKALLNGDLNLFTQITEKILKESPSSVSSNVLTNRNEIMATIIHEALMANKNPFCAIGASHLILNDGVLNRLNQKGWRFNQI